MYVPTWPGLFRCYDLFLGASMMSLGLTICQQLQAMLGVIIPVAYTVMHTQAQKLERAGLGSGVSATGLALLLKKAEPNSGNTLCSKHHPRPHLHSLVASDWIYVA